MDELIAAEQRVNALVSLTDRAEGRDHRATATMLWAALAEARRERNRLYKALQQQCGD